MVPRAAQHKAGQKREMMTRQSEPNLRLRYLSGWRAGNSLLSVANWTRRNAGRNIGIRGNWGIGHRISGIRRHVRRWGDGGIGSGTPPSAFQSDHIRSQAGMSKNSYSMRGARDHSR